MITIVNQAHCPTSAKQINHNNNSAQNRQLVKEYNGHYGII